MLADLQINFSLLDALVQGKNRTNKKKWKTNPSEAHQLTDESEALGGKVEILIRLISH